jgi:carbon storage regulator
MLVLTRKVGEVLVIDGAIEVTVLKVGRGKVRIGVSAPADVSVRRAEAPERPEQAGQVPHGVAPAVAP